MIKNIILQYERKEPTKDAKLYIIYCEGKKREKQYFDYFLNISTQIRLEIEPPLDTDNNSPMGLYAKANNHIIEPEEFQLLKYELNDEDEVWFVIDTDEWGEKINELREACQDKHNWHVSQSNPCFEVWLYNHFFSVNDIDLPSITNWKKFVNESIPGGFNSRNHPINIEDAINNSKEYHAQMDYKIELGCTEVYLLAKSFHRIVEDKMKELEY